MPFDPILSTGLRERENGLVTGPLSSPFSLSRPGLHVSQRTVPSIEFMNITRAANGKCERVRNGAVKDAGEASGRDVHACVHHGMAGEVRDHAFHALIVAARMASRGRDWPDVRPRL